MKHTIIYILRNDYEPEPYSIIEGAYETKEEAEKALQDMKDSGEYSEEYLENFEVDSIYFYKKEKQCL